MKLDKADKAFSLYIRTRDHWSCRRCGGTYKPPTTALHCSHFFGRTRESVRFDPENCDALCMGCHLFWEKEDREGYREFKIKQLGQRGFDLLTIRANTYQKKDREMAYLQSRALLQELG